jgi:ABC-type transport system involved in cytochrome c biogenesis permease subunit
VIHLATLLLYLAAFLLWLRALVTGSRGRSGLTPGGVAAAGVAVHLLALGRYTLVWGQLPLVGLAPSLSTLAFLIGLGLVAALLLREGGRVGILLLPLMVILEGVALLLGVEPSSENLDFRGAWLALHVTLSLTGVVGMALAAAAGALYLAQFRELKTKRLGRLFQFLPPLATLDRMGRIGVVSGFTALTIGIVLGWAWTLSFRQTLATTEPETLWGLFIWTVILAVLIARAGGGRVEQRSAVAGLVGFGLIVVSYLLVRATAGVSDLFL